MSDNDKGRTIFRPSPLQAMQQGAQKPAAAAPVRMEAAPPLPGDDIPQPKTAAAHRNPLLSASAQMLSLIASVRSGRAKVALPQLHATCTNTINLIDKTLKDHYNEDQLRRVRYALSATADDVALNLPDSAQDRAEWARRSLVVRFFQANDSGDRFWVLLDEMIADPVTNHDLLQLFHACLACGFEGRYRVIDGGKTQLQQIMQRIYGVLAPAQNTSTQELVPHWRGLDMPAKRPGFWTPLMLALAAAFALMLLIYIVLRLILMLTGQPAYGALDDTIPKDPLRLSRTAQLPPAPDTQQAQRIRTFLAPEIAQNLVTVVEDATTVRVRTTVGLFDPASDQMIPDRMPLFKRIAAALNTEPGPIQVEGYTDSDKIHTLAFPDNVALSQARAKTVADLVKPALTDPSRVTSQGFGENNPVADNSNPQGKAQNRRVEVVVQRREQ